MGPIQGELADRVRTDYLARNATRQTSRAIIEDLARREEISTAKVRHILTMGGPGYVRWTKEDHVWGDSDGIIRAAFGRFAGKSDDPRFLADRRKFLALVSDELFVTQKALMEIAKTEGFWPWHGREKEQFEEIRDAEKKQQNDQVARNNAILASRSGENASEETPQSPRARSMIGMVVSGILILFLAFIVFKSIGFSSQSAGSNAVALPASSDAPLATSVSTGGTATESEREAYSVDLYDKPSGLNSAENERYEKMSKEGQEYVDEQMEQYDRLCAQSNNC